MADHVATLSRSCFFYMWQLRSIKPALMPDATRTLIHAFISSWLDFCNSILAGVSSQLLQKLQVVQNVAARLVTGARKCEHMTPVLRELQLATNSTADHVQDSSSGIQMSTWCGSNIPAVKLWVDVNVHWPCSLAFCIEGTRQLVIPRTRSKYGDRSFAVQGPRIWNSTCWAVSSRHVTGCITLCLKNGTLFLLTVTKSNVDRLI